MHLPRLVGHIDADLCEGVSAIVMTISLWLLLLLLLLMLSHILRGQGIHICNWGEQISTEYALSTASPSTVSGYGQIFVRRVRSRRQDVDYCRRSTFTLSAFQFILLV